MKDRKVGYIDLKSFKEIRCSMEILGHCIFGEPSDGCIADGTALVPLIAIHDKEDVEEAIKVIAKTFNIDLRRLEEND